MKPLKNSQQNREEILYLQNTDMQTVTKAKKIVLKHLEHAIEEWDSATVAAMAEILSI